MADYPPILFSPHAVSPSSCLTIRMLCTLCMNLCKCDIHDHDHQPLPGHTLALSLIIYRFFIIVFHPVWCKTYFRGMFSPPKPLMIIEMVKTGHAILQTNLTLFYFMIALKSLYISAIER